MFSSRRNVRLKRAARSEPTEHGDEELHREEPNENHLPEPEITRGPVIRHDLRIGIEEPAASAEDQHPGQEHESQANAEKDPKRENRILVRMNDREHAASLGGRAAQASA
jgi:hypothetical protein